LQMLKPDLVRIVKVSYTLFCIIYNIQIVLSLLWCTDGVQAFDSSVTGIWPVCFVINELNGKERY
jgi:hypothetical protein